MIDENSGQKQYEEVRAYEGIEVSGNESVTSSIASVLSEGEALADDGEQYSSIQDAIDASDGWTFVGPGTFYENPVINKDDFMLKGSGFDTVVDAGDVGNSITITGDNVTVEDMKFLRGNLNSTGNQTTFRRLFVDGVGRAYGPSILPDTEGLTDNCVVVDTSSIAVRSNHSHIMLNTWINGTGGAGTFDRASDTDSIYAYNTLDNIDGSHGIRIDSDCIALANVINTNRVTAAGDDNVVGNNRTSSGTADFGAGNTIEGNITGTFN